MRLKNRFFGHILEMDSHNSDTVFIALWVINSNKNLFNYLKTSILKTNGNNFRRKRALDEFVNVLTCLS